MTEPNEIPDFFWKAQLRKLLDEFMLVEIADIDPPYDAVWETSIGTERMAEYEEMGVWND